MVGKIQKTSITTKERVLSIYSPSFFRLLSEWNGVLCEQTGARHVLFGGVGQAAHPHGGRCTRTSRPCYFVAPRTSGATAADLQHWRVLCIQSCTCSHPCMSLQCWHDSVSIKTTKNIAIATEIQHCGIENRCTNYQTDRKSTRLNSSHTVISYAVFCLKKKKKHK